VSFILKLCSSLKTSYLPAFLTLVAAFVCNFGSHLSLDKIYGAHALIFAVSVGTLALYFIDKNKKDLLFLALILLIYLTTMRAKLIPLMDAKSGLVYDLIMILCPIYFGYVFFLPSDKVSITSVLWLLLPAALSENVVLIQTIQTNQIFLLISMGLWLVIMLSLLFRISQWPSFQKSAMFFSCLLVGLGLVFYRNTYDFVIYFLAAVVVFATGKIEQIIYNYYRDAPSGTLSPNSFVLNERKKFPPKYSIAFFYIDNYTKLLKIFKSKQTDIFVNMILKKLRTLENEADIYRLSPREFCLVFFDLDVKQTYELMENIRRLIASTEFVTLKKKAIKLTITPVVSEKRRSDTDAKAVLLRMHENFRQKYRFTQNMTFCEEMEIGKKNRRSASR